GVLAAAVLVWAGGTAGVRIRRRLASRKLEFRELSRIGMALMQERDLPTLLREIVDQGKRLTGSDGGGMLLAETDAQGVTVLRSTFVRIDHLPELDQTTHTLAIDDASIIGRAAHICQPVAVADADNLPAGVPYQADHRLARLYG